MKKRESSHAGIIGACSLLTIFGVLCLTILALLSLRAALTEKKMAEVSSQAVSAWYQADLEAQRIFAELREENAVPGVEFDGECYHFDVPISQKQTLEVVLENEGSSWTVLRWQAVAHPEEINENLPVWQGAE